MFCFYGFRLMGPSLFIIGLLTVTCAVVILFYGVIATANTNPKSFFIWLGLGVVLGIVAGYLLMKYKEFGGAMLGGWGGAIVGVMVGEAFLYMLGFSWMVYAVTIGGAAGGAYLATTHYEPIVLGATAILGSFMIIRGVSCYAGGYMNEFEMVKLI